LYSQTLKTTLKDIMNNSQTNMKENQNVTLTDNGMVTNPTSLIECVDLFFSIGLMRGKTSS
jgi:hypothetical protein